MDVLFPGAGVLLVIGLVILAMHSGTSGGRHAQSGEPQVTQQEQNSTPRGGTRAGGRADDQATRSSVRRVPASRRDALSL